MRAPKLSKEFRPTRVYDILNESLQTLSDEDLRTMVDAMEKMDEIQDSLDMLNRAFADAKIIRTEYTRYNQYMLAKKAQFYLKKKAETESAQQEYEERQKEAKALSDALQDLDIRLNELSERKRLAETERNGLLDANLQDIDCKLEAAGDAPERNGREDCAISERCGCGQIQELFRKDYENQRAEWLAKMQAILQEIRLWEEKLTAVRQDLSDIQSREELEPDRSGSAVYSRERLKAAGIDAVPFYRTVEFAEGLSETECARLEAQLERMGLLDALVVAEKDHARIAQLCPEFLDAVIYVPEKELPVFQSCP